jgi:hypothetical protein
MKCYSMSERRPGAIPSAAALGLDARGGPKDDGRARQCLSRRVAQHDLAGFFGLGQRFEGRAADRDGARFLMMDRTPGRHEAGLSVKAGTVAALITDDERKAVVLPLHISMSATGLMTRVNSMAIPTADLRPRLDLPMIKRSPKMVSSTATWLSARPRADWPWIRWRRSASSDTGSRGGLTSGLPRAGGSGDLLCAGRSVAARSVIPGDDRRHSPDATKVRKSIVYSK